MNSKNIVVISLSIVIVGLMALTASRGGAYQGGQHSKVIENMTPQVQQNVQPQEPQTYASAIVEDKKDDKADEQNDELKALKDKAGSVGVVKISAEYRSRCAACHGVDGSGYQEGRKLMGPKLYGLSEETIYKDLMDFKDGRKENVVMKGLLINTTNEELKMFAKEIGAFSKNN